MIYSTCRSHCDTRAAGKLAVDCGNRVPARISEHDVDHSSHVTGLTFSLSPSVCQRLLACKEQRLRRHVPSWALFDGAKCRDECIKYPSCCDWLVMLAASVPGHPETFLSSVPSLRQQCAVACMMQYLYTNCVPLPSKRYKNVLKTRDARRPRSCQLAEACTARDFFRSPKMLAKMDKIHGSFASRHM